MARAVKLLQIALLILAPHTAGASPSQALYDLLHPIKSLSAQFIQTISDAQGAPYETSSGVFSVAEPNRVRWQVIQPMAQEIITDGDRVWVYDPDLQQVIVQSYDSNMATSPAGLFSGDVQQLSRDYQIDYKANQSALESYILIPKAPGGFYQRLQIDFIKQKPVALQFIDSLEQTIRIEFSEVQINLELTDSLFVFEVPPDVDVISNGN